LDVPARNELFAPGRMAYVIELEDENAETDIPTTLLRSRKDCPGQEVNLSDFIMIFGLIKHFKQSQATLSTNDIVINKLAQILSYLRQGKNQSKKAKKLKEKAGMENTMAPPKPRNDDSIYGNIGDYVASNKKGSDG